MKIKSDYSMFEATDEALYKEFDEKSSGLSSEILVLSIINGVRQYHYLDKIYEKGDPIHYKKIRSLLKTNYFNKLFRLTSTVDFSKLEEFLARNKELKEGLTQLDYFLKHFIEKEEYERCIIIKKIRDLVENS